MNECHIVLVYRDCAAVIAVSDVDNHLVVAFRGTVNGRQLLDQVLAAPAGMIESPIGGEVSTSLLSTSCI